MWLVAEIWTGYGGVATDADALDMAASVVAAASFDSPPDPWSLHEAPYGSCGLSSPGSGRITKRLQWYNWSVSADDYTWNNAEVPACPWGFGSDSFSGTVGPCGGAMAYGPAGGMICQVAKCKLPGISTGCVSVRTGDDYSADPDASLSVSSCGEVTEAGGLVLDNVTSCALTGAAWAAECAWVGGYESGTTPTCEDCECP